MIAPGVCRHCGCTDSSPCTLHDGDACCWTDRERMVCSAPRCVNAEAARVRASRAQQQPVKPKSRFAELKARGWGDGAIREELNREKRRRGRRRKAA
jgi:hypothetical protein